MLRSCGRGNITLTLVIANTNLGALRGLQQLWGGYIHEEASQSVLHKPIYKLAFGGEVTGKILEEIGPFLRLKQKQCGIALQFAETISCLKRPLAADTLSLRRFLQTQMKSLNYRGVMAPIGA